MNIAVIGDYDSKQYKDFVELVEINWPEEKILDLSLQTGRDYKTRQNARFEEIKSCHIFIFDSKWEGSAEIRQDITCAQQAGKDGFLYSMGRFTSFPCQR